MHPANISILHAAKVSYANLANNHVLDLGEAGFTEIIGSTP
jgi:poly-gamma-glutamate capsule biosynthesis protein CapA/YwtB (metallophosphatase superfamily)